jgi:predicted O-methyltransferase YrrM
MANIKELDKMIENKLSNYFSQQEALNEIKRMFPDLSFFPPTRGWAASPDFLLKLVELVVSESPKYVVELGSGVSSIVLGAAMKRFSQGKVDSFDHEESFTLKSKRFLEINELSDTVNVTYSPLTVQNFQGTECQWYDETKIKDIKNEIDLLVVDGPPRFLQERSRFLALPILFDKLSTNSTIILDDANRENEKRVVEDWLVFLKTNQVKHSITIFEYYDKGLALIEIKK